MSSDFTVTFWGTRGSIATPGFRFNCYGGNTTCVEIIAGDARMIFDAGTGIRDLGNKLLGQAQQGAHFSIFFSHTHWDHIQGFPFFTPAYIPNFRIDVWYEKQCPVSAGDAPRSDATGLLSVPSAMQAQIPLGIDRADSDRAGHDPRIWWPSRWEHDLPGRVCRS